MTNSELIQIILMGLLVVVTGIYVWRTHIISQATQKQAEASVRMAEEMREQRYTESLPLLAPTILPTWNTQGLALDEVPYMYLQSGIGIRVMWGNVGKGVAINSKFSLWAAPIDSSPPRVKFFPPIESVSLEVGCKKEISFHDRVDGELCDIPKEYQPRLLAEYNDIYERKIMTIQKFHITEENEHKRAFIGELYFTVNGKRLGEKVTKPK